MRLFGRFFGNSLSTASGTAIGQATSAALSPTLQQYVNELWHDKPDVPVVAYVLAEGVATGQVDRTWATDEARNTGTNKDRFDRLVEIANTGPGIGAAFEMWRRNKTDEAGFRRAAKREGLEQEWIDHFVELFYKVLTPGELAAAIHRGLVPNQGLVLGEQPEPPFKVEAYPEYPIDAVEEAKGSGYDRDRLGVLVGLQGLPMGVIEAAQSVYRKIITHGDYIRAFNTSNSRNEWAQAVLDYARQIPTARDFIENHLRGYATYPEMLDGAALHGMSPEHAQIIFENSGRAMNLHQITQALAYGANYKPTGKDDPDPYHQSTLVGPLRPEYYELNEALKYTLPSALYFRTLQQQHVLPEDEARKWYLRLGWPPELAEKVAHAYATRKTAATKEATAADLLTLWDGGKMDAAATLAALEALDYPPDEAQRKMDLVGARRVVGAKQSAIGDLHAAYKKNAIDDATALAALARLEIAAADAAKMVDHWNAAKVAAVQPPPTPPPV